MDLRWTRAVERKIRRTRRNVDLLILTFLGAFVFITIKVSSRMDLGPHAEHNRDGTGDGSCSDWLSLARAVDRANGDDAEPCIVPELTDAETRDCFQRRARRLGRPVSIVFIGDSRARVLFETLAEVFKLAFKAVFKPRDKMPYLPEASPDEWCSLGSCPYHASNDFVDIRHEWYPFFNKFMLSALSNMTEGCESGGAGGRRCPDALVVNSAVWYSTRTPGLRPLRAETVVLMYRLHMQQSQPALRRASQLMPTYWKLNEPIFSDFARDRIVQQRQISIENKQQLIAQAIAMEQSTQVPQMRLWSSAPVTVGSAVFSTCSAPTPDPHWQQIPAGCVLKDAIHLKTSFLKKLMTPFLIEMCNTG